VLLQKGNLLLESKERRGKWWVRLEQDWKQRNEIEVPAEVLIDIVSEWWKQHDGLSGDYWRGYQDAIKEVKGLIDREVG